MTKKIESFEKFKTLKKLEKEINKYDNICFHSISSNGDVYINYGLQTKEDNPVCIPQEIIYEFSKNKKGLETLVKFLNDEYSQKNINLKKLKELSDSLCDLSKIKECENEK
jgi:hypothetical protein